MTELVSGTWTNPVKMSLQNALFMALSNNINFQMECYTPSISKMNEEIQRAVFDPYLSGGVSRTKKEDTTGHASSTNREIAENTAEVRLKEFLPLGTTIEAGGGYSSTESGDMASSETSGFRWDIVLSQALLKGMGTGANLARLRQAKLEVEISNYELRAVAEALVAQVETAYWDYLLSKRSLEIYEISLDVAKREMEEVKERIRVGRLPETELSAIEAEVANREEQLITARATLDKRRLNLIRLLNLAGNEKMWDMDFDLTEQPENPKDIVSPLNIHLETAMNMRPDLQEARLRLKSSNLEVIMTRNGLLPKLDLFIKLAGSRYAESFADRPDNKESENKEYSAGVNLQIPLWNREARARYKLAMFSQERAQLALRNMEQLVQMDVRSAYVDVKRAEERVKATRATRILREKTLANEQEKFRVGRSTMFLVSQAHRDFVASQIGEIESIIEYRKALVTLYRLDGSLLLRRGITIE
jgi:outer membrane protein TolC